MTKTFNAEAVNALKPLIFGLSEQSHNRAVMVRFFERTVPAIEAAYAAGEITKVANKELRDAINRFVEVVYKITIAENFRYEGKSAELPEALQYLDYLYEARLIGSWEKKLVKAAKGLEDHPMVRASKNVIEALRPLQEAVEFLKSVEFSTVKRREEVKVQKEQEQRIKNDTDVVYQCVLPMKEQAMNAAEAFIRDRISNANNKLLAVGGVLEKIAPAVDWAKDKTREAIRRKEAKRGFFLNFVKRVEGSGYGEEAVYELDAERVETLVRQIRDGAAAQFEEYVAKLNEKINDITLTAEIHGDPWQGSWLTVETQNKGTQVWHTQMIVNCSKYGLPFNQWPTRLKG